MQNGYDDLGFSEENEKKTSEKVDSKKITSKESDKKTAETTATIPSETDKKGDDDTKVTVEFIPTNATFCFQKIGEKIKCDKFVILL